MDCIYFSFSSFCPECLLFSSTFLSFSFWALSVYFTFLLWTFIFLSFSVFYLVGLRCCLLTWYASWVTWVSCAFHALEVKKLSAIPLKVLIWSVCLCLILTHKALDKNALLVTLLKLNSISTTHMKTVVRMSSRNPCYLLNWLNWWIFCLKTCRAMWENSSSSIKPMSCDGSNSHLHCSSAWKDCCLFIYTLTVLF